MTWRPAGKAERQVALLWLAAVAGALLLYPFRALLAGLLPSCPMRAATGIPCPGCGATRAALALLAGHALAALALNPLAVVAGLAFVLGGLLAPMWVWLRGPLPVLPRPLPWTWRLALVGLLLANWGYLVFRRV